MLQSPEALRLPADLRTALKSAIPTAELVEVAVHDECLPLVLMLRSHAVIAFAVGDQDDYYKLYEAFKKHYLKYSAEWSTKDVAFIFCIPDGVKVEENFCSRVEVDVYFCRKYVVELGADIAASLARLPFLPLEPVAGASTRPPSAQTLLRWGSMKADLAASLVVPGKSSPGSILESCLQGKFGPPDQFSEATAQAPSGAVVEDRVQTTLKSISIQNFRAYRARKEFALGAAVTVLYGPNGFGKTSFFDAVDFAVTGGVSRFSKASGGLVGAAKHLDSEDEATEVLLTIERNGQEHVIRRDLSEPNNAWVDGKVTNRKDVLSLLTGGAPSAADRVDNMVALFRATHLFNQDGQELTRDVAEKSELPSDIVSRMLAFDDYVGGLKKTNEILRLAKQARDTARTRVQESRKAIDLETVDLKRLEELVSSDTSTAAIEIRLSEMSTALAAAQFNFEGGNLRDTRALRGMLESAAAESMAKQAMVTRCLEQLGVLKSIQEQLDPLKRRLDERQSVVKRASEVANAAADRLATAIGEAETRKGEEQDKQNRRDWFAWAMSYQPTHRQYQAERDASAANVVAVSGSIEQAKRPYTEALEKQQHAVAALRAVESARAAAVTRSQLVRGASEQASKWASAQERLEAARGDERRMVGAVERLKGELVQLTQQVLSQEQLVSRIEQEYSAATSSANSVKELVAELRSHVHGSDCLLCGHHHQTQDALLSAIDSRLASSEETLQLAESLADGRAKRQALIETKQQAVNSLTQMELLLVQTRQEKADIEAQREPFLVALRSVAITTTENAHAMLEALQLQSDDSDRVTSEQVIGARQQFEQANAAVVAAKETLDRLERERTAAHATHDAANRKLNELEAQARQGDVSLAAEIEVLEESLRAANEQLVQAAEAARVAHAKVETEKTQVAASRAQLATARVEHQQAGQTWNTYQANAEQILAALAAAGVSAQTPETELLRELQLAASRNSTALHLRDRAAELEVAIDAAATSAAFQSHRARIAEHEQHAKAAEQSLIQVSPWVDYFERVLKVLSEQQASATEHFTRQYGPRTAVIQQRLRPVYGFGEIEVSSRDSAIGIRVLRKGQALRPNDYFSQSQVQTLVLGLFLTACSSQTWSGFSSIMMDDPVTHFDDLNTYALLDLVSGLQSSNDGQRQFVISTCDEKLLQLARQKFRHLEGAAKFYRFSAIGADGPMVSEIPA